jgi:hypothetical protein
MLKSSQEVGMNWNPHSTITHALTNRDVALFVWFIVFAVVVLVRKDVRNSLKPLLRAFLSGKIVAPLVGVVVYVSLLVVSGYKLGMWQLWMLKDTFYWFVGSALAAFFALNRAANDEHYFKEAVLSGLRFAVLLEFVINLYVFSLVGELFLVPIVTLLALLQVFASSRPELAPVKTMLQGLFAIGSLLIIVHVGAAVVSDPGSVATLHNLQDFLLPLVLTLLFLPLVYGLALYLLYESLYVQLKIFGRDERLRRYTMWQIAKACRLRVSRVRRFSGSFLLDARSAQSREEVRAAINRFADTLSRHP